MAGKRRASPVKRLNVSQRMIKSNSSHTVFELWEIRTVWRCNVCIHKVQSNKTFSPPASDWKSNLIRTLFWELLKHSTLHQNTPPTVSSQFGRFITGLLCTDATNFGTKDPIFEEEDIWHSIKDSPERKKKSEQRSEVANCWILSNMKQEGRVNIIIISCPRATRTQNGLIMTLCGWWCCFVAPYNSLQSHPKLKACTWITFGWLLWSHIVRRTHLSFLWLYGFEMSSYTVASQECICTCIEYVFEVLYVC